MGKAWWGDGGACSSNHFGVSDLDLSTVQGCVKDSDVIVQAKRMNLAARLGWAKMWEGHTEKIQAVNTNY